MFGRITVNRFTYRAPHVCNVHPLDEVLDLPDGLYSTGPAPLSAPEAVRGSLLEAADAVVNTGDFDDYWRHLKQQQHHRAYATTA